MYTDLLLIATTMIFALGAFALIIVNDRFKNGVPDTWLSLQCGTLIYGLWLTSREPIQFGLVVLLISVGAGSIGFITLFFLEKGPNVFTSPILPGLKR